MKGASADDCAKMSSRPSASRTTTIGSSQSFLFCRRNSQTSPASESLPMKTNPSEPIEASRQNSRSNCSRAWRLTTLPFGSIKLELLLPRKVFDARARALLRLQKHERAEHEAVHLRAHEAGVSVGGRADYRLAAHVKGGVDEDGAARQSL